MFFIASKVLGFFTEPSNVIAFIGLIGIGLWSLRGSCIGARLMALSILLLAICGLSPLGDALLLPLAERFPQWQEGARAPDGIIVLGGSISPENSTLRGTAELNASSERLTIVGELARRFPNARIVFSGGNNNLIENGLSEADVAGRLFESFGVARERIILEKRSRTTAENASDTRDLVQPKPGEVWLLVTSAYHMPRSIGVFRKLGFAVEAYPVDWRTRGWVDAGIPFGRISEGLTRTDTAIHEWIGLVAYRLSRRIDECLPGPGGAK